MNRLGVAVLLLTVVLATACSGGSSEPTATTAASERAASGSGGTGAERARAELLAAARAAIHAHHALSLRVLWTNAVPATPRAIAGPALANLRRSAADRRRRGVRVKLISERFRILSLRLDPSYATVVALVSDPQRVRLIGRDGRPLGRPIVLNERARIVLRRLGRSHRFVVWVVKGLP